MEKCFDLLLSGKFEQSCLQLLLSKAIGYSIIFFSFTLKVPQIKNMLKSKSEKGLSYFSIYAEILIFLFSALYGFHSGNPFSTYGENIIILAQTIIILFLSWNYSQKNGSKLLRSLFFVCLAAFTAAGIMDVLPPKIWLIIGSASIPLLSVARLSQIWSSFKTKDTGPLSPFSFILSISGGVARAFTIYTEAFDPILIFTSIYGITLNTICLVQVFMYGNKSAVKVKAE